MNALMAFKVVLTAARSHAGGHQDCLRIQRACRLVEDFARTATESVRGAGGQMEHAPVPAQSPACAGGAGHPLAEGETGRRGDGEN